MENVLHGVAFIVSNLFEAYIISKYMKLFLGKKKVSMIKLIIIYCIRYTVCTLQYVAMPYVVLNMLTAFVTLCLIAMCYGDRIMNQCATSILIFLCSYAAEGAAAAIINLTNVSLIEKNYAGNAFAIMMAQMFFWMIFCGISIFKNMNGHIIIPRTFSVALVAISIVMCVMQCAIFIQDNIEQSIKILSALCMIIMLFIVVWLYDSISKNFNEKMQTEIMEREKNYYYEQAQILYQSSTELREFRHDIQNHLYVIEAMIGNCNQEAEEYIVDLTDQIDRTKIFCNTGNLALDSIINYKLRNAEKEDIKIEKYIALPQNINIQNNDLITILGNLIDNATEAVQNLKNFKYIKLEMKYKEGTLFIFVTNSYDGVILKEHDKIITKKEERLFHGIGLSSVKSVVDKYNGKMDIGYDDSEFKVKIMLYVN